MNDNLCKIKLSVEFVSEAQSVYFDSVVIPELSKVLNKHADALQYLGEEN